MDEQMLQPFSSASDHSFFFEGCALSLNHLLLLCIFFLLFFIFMVTYLFTLLIKPKKIYKQCHCDF